MVSGVVGVTDQTNSRAVFQGGRTGQRIGQDVTEGYSITRTVRLNGRARGEDAPLERSGVTTEFNGASVNFLFVQLLARAEAPT